MPLQFSLQFTTIKPTHEPAVEKAKQQVLDAGYPYVSVTTLPPHGRLNPHQHHSKNTHLVVEGCLTITPTSQSRGRYIAGDWINVEANVKYEGTAGISGCIFVEGHTLLSPDSDQRFVDRGDVYDV